MEGARLRRRPTHPAIIRAQMDSIIENSAMIPVPPYSSLQRSLAVVSLVSCLLIPAAGCNSDQASEKVQQSYFLDSHYSVFSDRPGFYEETISAARKHIGNQRRSSSDSAGDVRWGIVSHHLLIRKLIAEFFLRLSEEVHPKTIVVIGPNHFSQGHHTIAVSRLSWKTPFGAVNTNQEIVNMLVDSGVA